MSTGLASSSTQLTDLSDDIIQRHRQVAQSITVDNVNEILTYTVNKLLKAKGSSSTSSTTQDNGNESFASRRTSITPPQVPAIHLKIFYQVSAQPPIDLLIQTILDYKHQRAAQVAIAFTVLPAYSLQNFSTFLSICGIRHE